MADQVSVMVEGGKAAAGATLGSALGPMGLNVGQVVAAINEQTKVFAGMKVPVVIKVGPNRTFTLEVGHPPTAALLLKESKKEKGSGKAKHDPIGSVSMAVVKKVAEAKGEDLFGNSLDAKINQVLGTCVSMGLLVDGVPAREILAQRKGAKA
jgi:large subunit ribosomal protein L11